MNLIVKDSVMVLPSKGLPYEGKVPGGEVRLKVMTANEIKLLAGARGSGFMAINNILRRLVVDPPIPLEEFLSSDRLAMLYTIRALAYGPVFGFDMQCTSCGMQYRDEVNINELDVKYADEEEGFNEPIEVEIQGDTVAFVLPRGKFEKIAERQTEQVIRRQGADEAGDPYQMFLLAQCLKRWGSEEFSSFFAAYQFLEKLSAVKYWEFLDAVEENDFGLPRFIETICPRCAYVSEVPLPISAEFFRPKTRRSRRY